MRALLAVAMVWALAAGPAGAAPDAPPQGGPSFKGNWAGPPRVKLPGPGPAPGQSLADYFLNLKTGPRSPSRLKVLVLGGTDGHHHDSVPAAMAAVFEMGRSSGLWDAELRTDFALVNPNGGGPMHAGFQPVGLKDFDVVVVASASGDWGLAPAQKEAFVSFVRDQGKGLVVVHGGLDANHDWRDYIDMVGGEFAGHPFNTLEQPIASFPLVNEMSGFPVVRHLPERLRLQDEVYVIRNWSRQDVRVLLSLDEDRLDFAAHGDQVPPDHDVPVAWVKTYGKGRVFASSLGHAKEAFQDPVVLTLYLEAIKWAAGLTDAPPTPHRVRP